MTSINRRNGFRLAVLTTALCGLALVARSGTGSASTAEVRVYFAICEGSAATDTIKIKRIAENGTGATTIGDTTIAWCAGGAPTRALSGLAVHDGYAYFSWFNWDGSAAGLGRLSTTESGAAALTFATAPAGTGWLQVAPRVLNNTLYFYAHDGGQNPTNLRVMRVPLTGGAIQNCFTPSGSLNSMAIGVGTDSVYYAHDAAPQSLFKVSSDCSSSSLALDLSVGNGDAISRRLLTSYGASMIAESPSRLFMSTEFAGGNSNFGISHVDKGKTANDFVRDGTAVSPDGNGLPSLVWGVNRLYYKDGAARKMYAVTPGSAAEEVFSSQMTGILHHISVVSETATPPTTTTTTSTTTTAPPTTIAPTTTTAAKRTTAPVATTRGVTSRSLAEFAKLKVSRGAKISLTVASSTRRNCRVSGSKVVAVRSGNCTVTVKVTPKTGKATSKRITIKAKR